jgi:predicted outer membrane protein
MFLNKILSLPFGALFLVMLACDGPSSETNAKVPAVTRTLQNDPAFWDYAASSNMLQTEISRLATKKASTDTLRTFGQESVRFYEDALQQLKELAAEQGQIPLPDSLGAADKGLVKEFSLLEGEEFDTRYREFIISTHNAQLSRYEEALQNADDQNTRDWLLNMKTHTRQELQQLLQSAPVDSLREQ